jgi:hypothetical protein
MSRYNWGETHSRIDWLTKEIEPVRAQVVTHPMYKQLSTITAINTFMEHHVAEAAAAPKPSAEFVRATCDFIEKAPVHCQAAAFAFGREDFIPDMFDQVVAVRADEKSLDTFCDNLARHIQVDSEERTPMAMQMLADLCGDDDSRWKECSSTVNSALEARIRLWDGVLAAIEERTQ